MPGLTEIAGTSAAGKTQLCLQLSLTVQLPRSHGGLAGGIVVLCSVLDGEVLWCGVVWCGVVWCGVVWHGVVWRGVAWCGVVWRGVAWPWCGVVWCGVVWYP